MSQLVFQRVENESLSECDSGCDSDCDSDSECDSTSECRSECERVIYNGKGNSPIIG